MKTEKEKKASGILKAELARRNISNEDLRLALSKIGVEKTRENISKTINSGKFSFVFFLECAEAINLEKIYLE
jgi:hypothetical protein